MENKLLVTRHEAAELLSISVKTLDSLANAEKIKPVRIGSLVYYSPAELRAFVTKDGHVDL